ncbi:uncharacterized protein CCOS01_07266 [Colletotrichum costaricense]|uniref:Uncharacterized protein n=1 Tax=Colletotrichum costaricense TaxID=1209916 RepID=A0AAI9YXG9_9PEZI|nr:uncharacterized protein CCOS01_07266 [Colletotrichum costaricense]KAK1527004.1 hypothetical protein CCOS01_07266 [Colletotrichum costaricense]
MLSRFRLIRLLARATYAYVVRYHWASEGRNGLELVAQLRGIEPPRLWGWRRYWWASQTGCA